MAAFTELGQILLALGVSGSVAYWVGPNIYLAVALFVLVTSGLLMFDAARRQLAVEIESDGTVTLVVSAAVVATVLGMIWPSLPVIVIWGALKERVSDG